MKIFSTFSETFVSDIFPKMGDVISISLSCDIELEEIRLRYDNDTGLSIDVEMALAGYRDNAYLYSAEMRVPHSKEHFSYYFIVRSNSDICYYSKNGLKHYPPCFNDRFIFIPSLEAPSWVADATCYQIFPDRFCNGDPDNDVEDGAYEFDGAKVQKRAFSSVPEEFEKSRCLDFYNGDLKGIEDKLDYLKSFGITMLYINPVFCSRTVHRYDAIDFFNVDEKLGGNDALISLVRKAHEKGIRIILDISINHVGTDSLWYKKAKEGDPDFRSFFIHDENGEIKYWNGVKTLAALNYKNEKLRDLIYRNEESAMQKFLKPPFNIDGWRLDVAPEVARTESYSLSLELWNDIRTHLKAVKDDIYLVGEGWDDSLKYLDGEHWDATMNYFGSSRVFRTLLGEEDRFLTGGWGFPPKKRERIKAEEAVELINRYLSLNADQMNYFMMNLIDSHDTPRLHLREDISDDEYLALVMALYMLPGFPSIYYGDEIKLEGRLSSIEGSRYPMQWDEAKRNRSYLKWHTTLSELRSRKGFGTSAFLMESIGEYSFIIRRFLPDETLAALINLSPQVLDVTLSPFMMKGSKSHLIMGVGSADGLHLEVEGRNSALFSFKSC